MKITFEVTGKKDHSPIYVRFRPGRQMDQRTKTGLFVDSNNWSNETGQVKQRANILDRNQINTRLQELKDHIVAEYNLLNDKANPGKDWLKTTVDKFWIPEKYDPKIQNLFSFIQNFIDKAPSKIIPKTGRPVCYKQIREYERTFYYLKGYAEKNKKNLDFPNIDLSFYYEFIEYLKGKGLAQNTIGRKIETLKIFLNAANDEGLSVNPQYKSHRFTAIHEESESVYLNEIELDKISGLDLSDDLCLDRIRDLFLIGCWTGLRYSDWNKVTPENIVNGFLELRQAKTGGKVVIPLHSTVTAIIDKYGGELPPVISNQKFNQYLKKVAEKAGISEPVHKGITKGGIRTSKKHKKHELVTTHTGRRSFATNLYKAGLPTYTIMQVTGHRTEAAFLKYIKISSREHAEKLRVFWENQVQLKIV